MHDRVLFLIRPPSTTGVLIIVAIVHPEMAIQLSSFDPREGNMLANLTDALVYTHKTRDVRPLLMPTCWQEGENLRGDGQTQIATPHAIA